jgi:peptidylamidoglycolate lyase
MKERSMRRKGNGLVVMAAFLLAAGSTTTLLSQQKGGSDVTGPYELVENWPGDICGAGYMPGSTAGIFAETPDKVFIYYRGCLPRTDAEDWDRNSLTPTRNASGYDLSQKDTSRHPRWDKTVVVVNRDGKLVSSWDQHNKLMIRPHKVLISPYDPQRHVWIVDDGAQMFWKFTNDGSKIVQQWGEWKVPGADQTHFARPTDIAWLPDGTFFLSDGYVNTRVVKFDPSGKFVLQWGERGNNGTETRPGYMNTVHSVAVDSQRRVFVADRANSRVQIFDENGKYIESWTNIVRPYYIMMGADQHLWVADGATQKFTRFSPTGQLLSSWGTFGSMPGGFWGVHQFSTDADGNLYTADVHIGRAQKFRPRAGVDRSLLVPRQIGWGGSSSNYPNRLRRRWPSGRRRRSFSPPPSASPPLPRLLTRSFAFRAPAQARSASMLPAPPRAICKLKHEKHWTPATVGCYLSFLSSRRGRPPATGRRDWHSYQLPRRHHERTHGDVEGRRSHLRGSGSLGRSSDGHAAVAGAAKGRIRPYGTLRTGRELARRHLRGGVYARLHGRHLRRDSRQGIHLLPRVPPADRGAELDENQPGPRQEHVRLRHVA